MLIFRWRGGGNGEGIVMIREESKSEFSGEDGKGEE